jgi:hypothetical protein
MDHIAMLRMLARYRAGAIIHCTLMLAFVCCVAAY